MTNYDSGNIDRRTAIQTTIASLAGMSLFAGKLFGQETEEAPSVDLEGYQYVDFESLEAKTNRDAYATVAAYRTKRAQAYEVPMLLTAAQKILANNPELETRDVLRTLNYAKRELDKERGAALSQGRPFGIDQVGRSLIRIAQAEPTGIVALPATALGEAVQIAEDQMLYDLDSETYSEQKAEYQMHRDRQFRENSRFNDKKVWGTIWQLAQEDPRYRAIVDTFSQEVTEVPVTDTTEEIWEDNPILARDVKIAELNSRLKDIIRNQKATKEDLKLIGDIRKYQLEKIREQQAQAKRAEREQAFRLTHGVMSSAIGVVAHFGDEETKKTAMDLSIVLDGQLSIALQFSKIEDIDSLVGGVKLGADILETALGIVGSLMGGPSPEQLILEQIAELRKEVQKMHQDLAERIDGLDTKIGDLHREVVDGFRRVEGLIEQNGKDIQAIKREMMQMQLHFSKLRSQLDRAKDEILKVITDIARRDINDRKRFYLDYEKRRNGGQISFDEWDGGLGFFSDNAQAKSRDGGSLLAPATREELENGSVVDFLRSDKSSEHLDFISRVLHERFGFSRFRVPGGRFPSVTEWLAQTDNYLRLMEMGPEHVPNVSEFNLVGMRRLGEQILHALRTIKTDTGADGVQVLNDPLMQQLFANYEQEFARSVKVFRQSIANFETEEFDGRIDLDGGLKHVDDDLQKPFLFPIELIKDGIPGKAGTPYAGVRLKINDIAQWPFSHAISKFHAMNPEVPISFHYTCEWVNERTKTEAEHAYVRMTQTSQYRRPTGQVYPTNQYVHKFFFDETLTHADIKVTLTAVVNPGGEDEYVESATKVCPVSQPIRRRVRGKVRDLEQGGMGLSGFIHGDPNIPVKQRILGMDPDAYVSTATNNGEVNAFFDRVFAKDRQGDILTFASQIPAIESEINKTGTVKEYEQTQEHKEYYAQVQSEVDEKLAQLEADLVSLLSGNNKWIGIIQPEDQAAITMARDRMNGARRLLQATMMVGMPETLEEHLDLSGSIEGPASIPDSYMLPFLLNDQPSLGLQLVRDPEYLLKNSQQAQGAWRRYVEEISASPLGVLEERFPQIEDRIFELQVQEEKIKALRRRAEN